MKYVTLIYNTIYGKSILPPSSTPPQRPQSSANPSSFASVPPRPVPSGRRCKLWQGTCCWTEQRPRPSRPKHCQPTQRPSTQSLVKCPHHTRWPRTNKTQCRHQQTGWPRKSINRTGSWCPSQTWPLSHRTSTLGYYLLCPQIICPCPAC